MSEDEKTAVSTVEEKPDESTEEPTGEPTGEQTGEPTGEPTGEKTEELTPPAYSEDPRVTTDEDRRFGRCCGRPLKATGEAWRRARDAMRRPAGKTERRGVYVNVICPDCNYLRRVLVGRRPKKKKRERK